MSSYDKRLKRSISVRKRVFMTDIRGENFISYYFWNYEAISIETGGKVSSQKNFWLEKVEVFFLFLV